MGTFFNAVRMTLGQEDTLGRVLTGSTGKGAKALWTAAKKSDESTLKSFIDLTSKEIDTFETAMSSLQKTGLDKAQIKALKKAGGNSKTFFNKMTDICKLAKNGNLTDEAGALTEDATKILKAGLKDGSDDLVSGVSKTLAKNAKSLGDSFVKNNADDVLEATAKSGKGLFKNLKGKGGTLGILLTAAFEIPSIVKAFKNGDGLQQIGRSTINLAGCTAGAAAGAAIGSIIPGAGTVIGGLIGGICGIAGSLLGGAVSDKIGSKIFGKSIEDKKEDAAENQEAQLAYQQQAAQLAAMSPYQLNTSI